MISSQRMILKTFASIINFNSRISNNCIVFNFSADDSKHQKYQYPFNFNRQQYKGYIKKVQKAKAQVEQAQKLEEKNILPRRKRRVYDKPRHDINTTNYAAWRLYDYEQTNVKLWQHSLDVVAKLQLQPKWVVHAFGKGIVPLNNPQSSHRQYVFEDVNLSQFILYEYRNTTHYEKNIPNYDYENQQHLRPEVRKAKRVQPQEFWQSEQKFQFRLNCSTYAQHLKFCQWIRQTIQKSRQRQSYDAIIDKKFGRAFSFNEKEDMQLFRPKQPFIMHAAPESFIEKKSQSEKPAQKKQKKEGKGKGKKQKQAQSEKPAQKSAQKPKSQEIKTKQPVATEQPVKVKGYNFSFKLDEQYRKQAVQKVQQKKSHSQRA